jgi:hypothetical protein
MLKQDFPPKRKFSQQAIVGVGGDFSIDEWKFLAAQKTTPMQEQNHGDN